mgnify:CR=1 FL=1
MTPPAGVRIVEVGPRDGLQYESRTVPTDAKVAFIDALSATGLREIEVTAFVSPKWIPKLADADDVARGIRRAEGVAYSALVPNERGLERAMAAGVDRGAVFTAATDGFTRNNINCTVAESFERFRPVFRAAAVPVRAYVSTAFWCPFEGRTDPARTAEVARRLADLGAYEVSIGDTTGKADGDAVRALLDFLLPFPVPVALHFHDTYGKALANALVARREYGIAAFDGSAGGLGGCPYAPGAAGNVATEALVRALEGEGAATGVDADAVAAAARLLAPHIGRSP